MTLFIWGTVQKTYAQTEVLKPARILFLLDGSSSMLDTWNAPENRFNTASRLIAAIVDSIHAVNKDVAFAVRVFGNQYPAQEKNCFDSRLEVPFGISNEAQIRARLKYLTPRGFSPIAWSLKETAELDFTESSSYAYSIILVTDGGESCGGDICATVTNLLAKKISFKPYILSLVDYEPLKLQYACLGKYLTVAKEKDIVPAINTIINDNRRILTIKTNGVRQIAQQPQAPRAETVARKPVLPVVPQKQEPEAAPEPVKTTPPPVVAAKEPEPAIVLPKVTPVDRIYRETRPHRMGLLFTLPGEERIVQVPPLKMNFKVEEEPRPVAAQPAPKPVVQSTAAAKPPVPKPATTNKPPATRTTPGGGIRTAEKKEEILDFVVKTEEAKESTLQIYFTNGQGKPYRTEPRMVIKDSKTGKEVKNVYRNVTNGEPDPIKLEPGTYDILMPGSKSKANGIVIEAGKNKKYYMRVGAGSLTFFYPTAPGRPVTEYRALVSKRFKDGPVVNQNCNEELPYDPDNYHVEINTLPPMMLNMDLEFNVTKVIPIKEAGTIQITNRNNMGKVQFWYEMADKTYVPFYEMMVTGNTQMQQLNFLPGNYQVRYYKGRVDPLSKAEVIPFSIKSNATTNVELEK